MNAEDRALLDFDEAAIAEYSRAQAESTLAGEHGDTFRTHLIAARWVEQWADRLGEARGGGLGGNGEEAARKKGSSGHSVRSQRRPAQGVTGNTPRYPVVMSDNTISVRTFANA